MPTTVSRRQILKIAGASGVTIPMASIAACSGGPSVIGGAPATIRFSWWGNPDRHELTQRVLELYAKKFPDTKVGPEFGPWANYHEKLLTSAAGGQAPDLMQVEQTMLAEFAKRGVLADLRQFSDVLKLDQYTEDSLAAGTFDGTLSALSFGDTAPVMFLDATVIEGAGLAVPEWDWTWDDFARLAGDLTRKVGGDYRGAENMSGHEWALEVWTRQRQSGVGIFTNDGLGLTRETLTGWFEYWEELRKADVVVGADVMAEATSEATLPLIRHKSATWSNYVMLLKTLSGITDHKLAITTIPNTSTAESSAQQWVVGSSWLAIYAKSKSAPIAAALAGFLLNDVEAGKILKLNQGIPPAKPIRDAIASQLDEWESRTLEYVEYVRSHSKNLPYQVPAASGEVFASLSRVSQDLGFGRSTVSEAVDAFFADAERAL